MEQTLEIIISKLRKFSTPNLCDGAGQGQYRTMDYQIKPYIGHQLIVGPAVTVQVPEGISGFIPEAIMTLKKGEVLVVAGHGCCNKSYWGDHRSLCASMMGAEAVIIDGSFRDLEGCREIGFPIFARGITPGSAGKESIGQLNVPVICGGIEVCPGDLIVGDCNGICVIKPEQAEEIMRNAEKKILAEEQTFAEMKRTGTVIPRIRKI
ncbi:MAG: RraA family protein [Coprococcus sp.]